MIVMRRAQLAILTMRLDRLHDDVASLTAAHEQHLAKHERDRQMAITARRWYVGTLLTVISVATPISIVLAHIMTH